MRVRERVAQKVKASTLDHLSKEELVIMAARVDLAEGKELSEDGSFWMFCQDAWHVLEPSTPLKWNWHLNVMAAYLESYGRRDIKRLILNVPPGSMKSLMVSVFYPAWEWTRDPGRRFINLTNEITLATRDSRRMRDLIQSDWYQARWGHLFSLSQDQKEKTLFENTGKGFRQSLSFTGNISGKRGTDLVIDDPIDTKKAFSDVANANVLDTYDQAVSSRLNDPIEDSIVVIMQRTRSNDLTGHLMLKKATQWVQVIIPMEGEEAPGFNAKLDIGMTHYGDKRFNNGLLRDIRKPGELMFPKRYDKKSVDALKEDLGEYGTAGQLQQRPSPLGGGIIKKSYWRVWPDDMPLPEAEHIFVSWDTAYTTVDAKDNSFSAMTAWGVFWHEQQQKYCLFVLGRWYERCPYPRLRQLAQDFTEKYRPDAHLVERKASGQSLIQDMKRIGSGRKRVRIRTYSPDVDKIARAHASTPTMESGMVYVPNKPWAHELIKYCSEFPTGAPPSSDLTDTVTQAVLYLKNRWWVEHPDDIDEADTNVMPEQDYDEADELYGSNEGGVYG